MDTYISALFIYIALNYLVAQFINNHYQNRNHGTSKKKETQTKNAINRRAHNPEYNEFEGLYSKRSNPTIPPANEYEASSIEPPSPEMPFEAWLAAVEHQSFVEEMRMDLEGKGILMSELDL